jgi:hypothetical protein
MDNQPVDSFTDNGKIAITYDTPNLVADLDHNWHIHHHL